MSATIVTNAHTMMIKAELTGDCSALLVAFADGFTATVPIERFKTTAKQASSMTFSLPNPSEIWVDYKDGREPEVFPWTFARSFGDADYHQRVAQSDTTQRELLAQNLKALRTKQGLTQGQLANRSGVSRMTISRIENKHQYQPTVQLLNKLSAALGHQMWDLFAS